MATRGGSRPTEKSESIPLPRHRSTVRFHDILRELGELHNRKSKDYGKSEDSFFNIRAATEWGIQPWVAAMLRATDKIRRLQSLSRTGKLHNESAADSLRDIAVYSIIALVLMEEDSACTDSR